MITLLLKGSKELPNSTGSPGWALTKAGLEEPYAGFTVLLVEEAGKWYQVPPLPPGHTKRGFPRRASGI